ncbi:hypothetical protein [Salirhabdus sp. Marseille-P4669]|uniref:hypothetical protein n=1 Tax=Salirhabdus sp. Marseille-P4669 TaxID=2042310 RepID=UPI000C7E8323|nr:hypothetical protein [Salirhabdus sp. Marseille-P4669]
MTHNLHQQLQQLSKKIHDAEQAVLDAQGSQPELLEQALQQLEEVERELQNAQNESGIEATHNPQFQQTYEQLHDIRQQVQDIKRNNDGF